MWDILTGKDTEIRELNRQEIEQARKRDRDEMHEMVQKHLEESRELHKTLKFYKQCQREEEWRLKRQMAAHLNTATEPEEKLDIGSIIADKLAKLESKIASMSGDIAAMQDALDDAMLSDDVKAKIRTLIERAKEIFFAKRLKQEQAEKKKKQEEEQLIQTQQRLFYVIQQYEKLKQQQAEQQRIATFNSAFNARIQAMQYSLNGVPMYKISISDPPLDIAAYRQTLSYQSSATLIKSIKTKPAKGQRTTTADLAKSTATISEILKRAKSKPSAPPKTRKQRDHKIKLKL